MAPGPRPAAPPVLDDTAAVCRCLTRRDAPQAAAPRPVSRRHAAPKTAVTLFAALPPCVPSRPLIRRHIFLFFYWKKKLEPRDYLAPPRVSPVEGEGWEAGVAAAGLGRHITRARPQQVEPQSRAAPRVCARRRGRRGVHGGGDGEGCTPPPPPLLSVWHLFGDSLLPTLSFICLAV